MRIDGSSRTQASGYAGGARRSGASTGFAVETPVDAGAASTSAPVVAPAGLDALLALQAADDALSMRRKAVRRGKQMLDVLDEMKADLLAGRLGEGRLNQLLALLGQARERIEPGLDGALDDIELRVRVELAKHGR